MEDERILFLKKTLEHFEDAEEALQRLDFRNFASRFYYGYISLLYVLGIKRRGDWHKKESYKFPSESFKDIWEALRVWRIKADYEFFEGKSFSLFEEEFKEFLKEYLIEHLEEEIKPFLEENEFLNLGLKLILLKKLEGLTKWLRLIV